jgi:uncharacterized protein
MLMGSLTSMPSAAMPLSITAAFVAGIASSAHCTVMCGGISGALGMRGRERGLSAARALTQGLGYQVGRTTSYAVAGALCGAFGGTLSGLIDLAGLVRASRAAAGLLLIALAVQIVCRRRGFNSLERFGARFWRRISPLAAVGCADSPGGAMLLGMVWGWMPCGMIYSMLAFAALAGGATQGAATLAAFGLGTWPAVLGGGLISAQISRLARARGLYAVTGALLAVFGAITAIAPFVPMRQP